MNAMNVYQDGLLEGPPGLTNAVSRLAPILGRDTKMSQSMSWLSDTLANACRSAMLNNEMVIARLMTHMEDIEGQNMKIVKAREFKKARFEGGFSKGGGGISKPQCRRGNNTPNPRFNKE